MGKRGPKPKPTAIKVLEGNPGKRKLNDREPIPVISDLPLPPEWLEPAAREEWERLARNLHDLGLLTDLDMAPFAVYCQAYARWKEAEEYISKNGSVMETKSGYLMQVPQVGISKANQAIMLKAAAEFGLTPSARAMIVAGKDREPADDMEALLS